MCLEERLQKADAACRSVPSAVVAGSLVNLVFCYCSSSASSCQCSARTPRNTLRLLRWNFDKAEVFI
jgi:hypothetical protein